MHANRRWVWALGTMTLAIGCGGATPPAPSLGGESAPEEPRHHGSSLGVSAEIGALDPAKAEAAWKLANAKINKCFEKGVARIPYLSGSASFMVRVAKDGSTRFAYLKDSTLGDHETEGCMVAALKGTHWPSPEGGEEGIAEQNGLDFDPGGDERAPVDWSPEQLGKDFAKARSALAGCRSSAGTGPIKVTMYVETDGRPKSVGMAASDEKGERAVQSVVDALSSMKFPSPGSYASKVTVSID